jgi:hypothetical protein
MVFVLIKVIVKSRNAREKESRVKQPTTVARDIYV